jgi:wobble nucleotide-excising tRNase
MVASRYDIYNDKEKKIVEVNIKKKTNTEEIDALDLKIKTSEKLIKDFELPAGEINKDLENFLGHSELKFESKKDEHGEVFYEIQRNGTVASNLSEGEKTVVSLIYFLRKLSEDGFDSSKGSIFIDDPISSMDSQFMYAAYSFIISAIETDEGKLKVGQIFISTHNYDFFNLLKKKYWKNHKESEKRRCELYMLRMKISVSDKRSSNIYELDKLLKIFESDYQYLYSKLIEFEKATDIEQDDLMRIYPFPNFARRVLETFLSFKYPTRTDIQGLINAISAPAITKDIKESVYRFVNIQSHGTIKDISTFNAALLEPTAKGHILNALKIIRVVDEDHSKEMEKSIQ